MSTNVSAKSQITFGELKDITVYLDIHMLGFVCLVVSRNSLLPYSETFFVYCSSRNKQLEVDGIFL